MIIPFCFLEQRKSQVVGDVTEGDLVVNSGQVFSIAEGSVKRYTNVIIRSGGTLRITGNVGSWTEIGVSGNLICDGTLECRVGYDGQSTPTSGTFAKTSVFGLGSLSHTIVQANGGRGGNGSANTGGGAQSLGRGGGGAGGYQGGAGGVGGSNGASNYYAGGIGGGLGNGSTSTTGVGGNGSGGGGGGDYRSVRGTYLTMRYYYGGGGGGGYRGHHGNCLVLYVEGTIGGSGIITCRGRDGFYGGNGSSFDDQGAGGGGGGAGGAGGKLIVKYKDLSRVSFSAAGGAGGAGGAASSGGQNGAAGSAGAAGTLTLSKI